MADMDRRDCIKVIAMGAAAGLSGCADMKKALLSARAPALGHFDQFGICDVLLGRVISRGLSSGGDHCEVFVQHRISHNLELEDGAISQGQMIVDLGAGIRVIKGEAIGFAYSEDLSENSLLDAADTARAIASGPARPAPKSFGAVKVESRYPVEVPWDEVGIPDRLPVLSRADEKTRKENGLITRVTVGFQDSSTRILVADSTGRIVTDDQPLTRMTISCTGSRGSRMETGSSRGSSRDGLGYYSDSWVDELAAEAAAKTARQFEAGAPPPGTYPVVLGPAISGILLHEAMGHGFEADFNRRNLSVYAGSMGKRVAPKGVTIIDDGTRDRLRGSINIDDEGTPGQRTVLVEDGILVSYMHDLISARYYGVEPTGSGRRESFRYPPNPRMRTTYMLSGPMDPEEIIRSVKRGLYVDEISNGNVMIGKGDFTFYMRYGRMIENGRLSSPVKDANLIGSGPRVLETIDMVGNDLAFHHGGGSCGKDGQWVPVSFGLPTARAGGISVGGRQS